MCVCVWVLIICGGFDNCVGVLVIGIYCALLFVQCFCIVSFMCIYSCFVCTSVRNTATE